MLRVVLFAAAGGLVCGSDDQSLMQQGVGVEARASAFQSAFRQVQDVLSASDVGSVNKLAIESVLRTVQLTEKLEPDDNDTVILVIGMLNSILSDLAGEPSNSSTAISLAQTNFINCKDTNDTEKTTAQGQFNDAETLLNTCKNAEKAAASAVEQNCKPLYQMFEHLCQKPSFPALNAYSTLDDWKAGEWTTKTGALSAAATAAKSFVDGQWGVLDPRVTSIASKKSDCTSSQNDYLSYENTCPEKHTTFITKSCMLYNAQKDFCDSMSSCYSQKRESWNNIRNSASDGDGIRTHEAQILSWVVCVLDKLTKNIIDTTDSCGTPAAPVGFDSSLYQTDNVDSTLPDEESCQVTFQVWDSDGYSKADFEAAHYDATWVPTLSVPDEVCAAAS